MTVIIGAIIMAIGLGCAMISLFQFREKGFLFNNAYLWVSKAEREKLDKKPYYRQSAISFALLAAALLFLGLECILDTGVLMIFMGLFIIGALVYAIASSVIIERRSR